MTSAPILVKGNILVAETGQGREAFSIYSARGFQLLTELWVRSGWQNRIFYEPTWMGIPALQLAEDLLMMQELIFEVRPEVIVETGTADGGGC